MMVPQNITSTKVVELSNLLPNRARAKTMESPNYLSLKEALLQKTAKIGVIGLGYVGLPLSTAFAKAGYSVLGFDNNPKKVDSLMEGQSYIQDVPTSDVAEIVRNGKLKAYSQFLKLRDCDVLVICVPTPLSKSKDPDMSYILQSLEKIGQNFRPGQLIILESTTYPGTTQEVLLPELEKAGLATHGREFKCGEDFFLAFSPERVDPGNPKYNVINTPKVVGGVSPACGELASIFYSNVMTKVVRVSSPESAEMVKLLENTFRCVNIALVNEVAIMCEKLGVDCWEVIEAASSKPFGFMPFYPGPGLGGHCIPIDPTYLSWKLRSLNYTARFIDLANTINSSMPEFCVERINDALNAQKKAINGSKILVVGVAYKKDIDDLRESPALDVIHTLEKRGAHVEYYDPYIPEIRWEHFNMDSVKWSSTIGKDYDLVVITTDHSNVNYAELVKSSKQIVDTRNALKDYSDPKISKI